MSSRPVSAASIVIALAYGFACHGVFALGVGMMIGAMYVGLQPVALGDLPLVGGVLDQLAPWAADRTFWAQGGLDGWRAMAANTLLLLQFPLGHSLFLTRRGRALLARLAPNRETGRTLAPTTYALLAGAQLALLFGLWSPSGTVWIAAEGAALWVMTGLFAAAWALLAKAMLDSGLGLQSGFIGWFALLRGRQPAYPDMPTRGLYRFLRHPIYVAFTLTLWTTPIWSPDQLAVAIAFTAYCLIGPKFKERRFLALHGDRYAAFLAETPYWTPRRRPAPRRSPPNDRAGEEQSAAL